MRFGFNLLDPPIFGQTCGNNGMWDAVREIQDGHPPKFRRGLEDNWVPSEAKAVVNYFLHDVAGWKVHSKGFTLDELYTLDTFFVRRRDLFGEVLDNLLHGCWFARSKSQTWQNRGSGSVGEWYDHGRPVRTHTQESTKNSPGHTKDTAKRKMIVRTKYDGQAL